MLPRYNGVFKFGGTSMATSSTLGLVTNIIAQRHPHCVVVSAPGALESDPRKITDLLIQVSSGNQNAWQVICDRFFALCQGEQDRSLINVCLESIQKNIPACDDPWLISRGEFLMAQLMAQRLGRTCIDAANIIRFCINTQGHVELDLEKTLDLICENCQKPCVIPGFYGALEDGTIVLLGRGGSDTTGALIARALQMQFTKWTDVDGFYTSDPRIGNGLHLDWVSYTQALELSATLIHPDALQICAKAHIPMEVRSTFEPNGRSTRIEQQTRPESSHR